MAFAISCIFSFPVSADKTDKEVIIPRSNYVFKKNDIIVFIAKKDQIAIAIDKKFENQLFETKAKGAIISNFFDWKTTNVLIGTQEMF